MARATGSGMGEIEQPSTQINGYPRDLLRRFVAEYQCHDESRAAVDSSEIELNLGLSLGGCFGVDPKEKRLVRSSSIAGFEIRDFNAAPLPVTGTGLIRTCSLPAETEDERRKRKEMQSLRRMEAKRKRSEKQRNSRAGKDQSSLERNCEEDKRGDDEGSFALSLKGKVLGGGGGGCPGYSGSALANGLSSSAVTQPYLLPAWAAAAAAARGVDSTDGMSSVFAAAVALRGFPPSAQGFPPSSQGSLGSQGSSSSGVSDFGNRSLQGSSMEARSPSSVQSLPDHVEHKAIMTPATPTLGLEKSIKRAAEEVDNPPKKPDAVDSGGMREMRRNAMEDMPCVSTRGDGPNGKKIDGFLYKYRKGEEVRIVCVCHGSFLTPAEFVRHAGGGDVAHPLRHIVVNPSSSSFL